MFWISFCATFSHFHQCTPVSALVSVFCWLLCNKWPQNSAGENYKHEWSHTGSECHESRCSIARCFWLRVSREVAACAAAFETLCGAGGSIPSSLRVWLQQKWCIVMCSNSLGPVDQPGKCGTGLYWSVNARAHGHHLRSCLSCMSLLVFYTHGWTPWSENNSFWVHSHLSENARKITC